MGLVVALHLWRWCNMVVAMVTKHLLWYQSNMGLVVDLHLWWY